MRGRGLLVATALAALVAGCAPTTFETAQELYDAAGGEGWCNGPLVVSFEPWVGSCGTDQERTVVAISLSIDELQSSVRDADEGLLLLVPEDPETLPGWQLRSASRARLLAAQSRIGGVLLEDETDVQSWLDGEAPDSSV